MKPLLKRLISNDRFWHCCIAPLLGLGHRLDQARYGAARAKLERSWGQDWSVRAGPFAGLRYPELIACGSALHPKILGTYESELHPFFEEFRATSDFRTIYDIGSAEGYYAVGLARMFPRASVRAFDIDAEARELCRRMAAVNGVTDRVDIASACTPAHLQAETLAPGGLVVCDCEGYEQELFTPETVRHLQRVHLVVELHQHHGYSSRLIELFGQTHDTTVVPAMPERDRIARGRSLYVTGSDCHVRAVAFQEWRPDWMSWVVAIPRAC